MNRSETVEISAPQLQKIYGRMILNIYIKTDSVNIILSIFHWNLKL